LVIYGGLVLGVVGMGLPETARNVVGNGEMEARWWGRTWWSLLMVWRRDRKRLGGDGDAEGRGKDEKKSEDEGTPSIRRSFKMPNPFAAVRIIFWRDTALVLWMAGSPYAVWYCVQASIPPIYKDIYGFNDFQIGLAYLTGGFGTVLASYANGKLMDWNYRMTARQIGHTVDRVSGDDLNHFPIERARARGSWHILGVYMCVLIGYGWAVQRRAHESIPLILQFILAAICTVFQQTFNILLVDIFSASPSTAAASGNITRCALSAVAVAILQPLVDRMGRGWYFTFLGLLSGGGGVAANWLIITRGMAWRHHRLGISHVAEKGKETMDDVFPTPPYNMKSSFAWLESLFDHSNLVSFHEDDIISFRDADDQRIICAQPIRLKEEVANEVFEAGCLCVNRAEPSAAVKEDEFLFIGPDEYLHLVEIQSVPEQEFRLRPSSRRTEQGAQTVDFLREVFLQVQ
ncbi:MAG: hypothetical protein LQ348_006582, partial [Seirophora lacunosa]